MPSEQERYYRPIETSTAEDALRETEYRLNPVCVEHALHILGGLPSDAKVQVIGEITNPTPRDPDILENTTFHHLSVLPKPSANDRIETTRHKKAELKAAEGLANIVEYHQPKTEMPPGRKKPKPLIESVIALGTISSSAYYSYKGAGDIADIKDAASAGASAIAGSTMAVFGAAWLRGKLLTKSIEKAHLEESKQKKEVAKIIAEGTHLQLVRRAH